MALMERVTTLLRANLNDMLDRAENPQKMLKQLLLDMENQLLQVKTQVAIAVADQHLLEKKKTEHEDSVSSWKRKAQTAVDRGDDALARAALERVIANEKLLASYSHQLEDQREETQALRESYARLEQKLQETRTQGELLLLQLRRANNGATAPQDLSTGRVLGRLREASDRSEAVVKANRLLQPHGAHTVEDRFIEIERDERVEELLQELKARPKLLRE